VRTTITLDDDVAAKLQMRARKSGRSFKTVVNDALRTGLSVESQAKQLPPFKIKPQHVLRLKRGLNYDKLEEVFDQLDTPRRLR
jgi:hypothetical protein